MDAMGRFATVNSLQPLIIGFEHSARDFERYYPVGQLLKQTFNDCWEQLQKQSDVLSEAV